MSKVFKWKKVFCKNCSHARSNHMGAGCVGNQGTCGCKNFEEKKLVACQKANKKVKQ